jgi:hypothetical protein
MDLIIRPSGEKKIIPQVQCCWQDITQIVIRVLTDEVYPAWCRREDFRRRTVSPIKYRDEWISHVEHMNFKENKNEKSNPQDGDTEIDNFP